MAASHRCDLNPAIVERNAEQTDRLWGLKHSVYLLTQILSQLTLCSELQRASGDDDQRK